MMEKGLRENFQRAFTLNPPRVNVVTSTSDQYVKNGRLIIFQTTATASSWMKNPTENDRLLPAVSGAGIMRVQPHYYRERQVEPCHRIGEVARRSS